jgi:two-component system chemotaxis response regulator CheB
MLSQILASDPGIEVVGAAQDGVEAVEMVEQLRPDLVTMDIHMPRLDGLGATEKIMAYTPTPILVVSSSVHGEGIGRAFDALRLGALEVIKKPEVRDWADLERIGSEVIKKVKILARVRVITHIGGRKHHVQHAAKPRPAEMSARRSLVAIGSSTGGPSALLEVLGRLSADFCAPVVIAQHIADGFVPGFVEWLDSECRLRVVQAREGMPLEPGFVFVAPTNGNVIVGAGTLSVRRAGDGQLHVPSANALFESVATAHGSSAVGVIMTGMGADGATGLRAMREAGAATIAQDEASCTVFGMPRAAIEAGAAEQVLPLEEIAGALEQLVAE